MPYCIYLRKSRADLEAEALGAGDTLKRHETTLTALALARGLEVAHIYREIVSGDTISARPQMQQMLSDVEKQLWEGVLCMEVERLARGDTVDQGIVAQTFKYTGTPIITPHKVYDPNNDMDEEFFEFSLFMARREYKTIKRRLMAGRIASVREGNYMSPKATFGYERVRAQGRGARWKLVVKPEEAAIVRNIFDWYENGIDGHLAGAQAICDHLNALGFRTAEGRPFYPSGIRAMLHNITYTGALAWNKRVQHTTMSGGMRVTRRVLNPEPMVVHGTHEPIISDEQFARVQRQLASRTRASSVRSDRVTLNPLRGLIVCAECGRRMQRKAATGPYRHDDFICCITSGCPACSAQVKVIERVLLSALGSIREAAAPVEVALDAARASVSADRSCRDGDAAQPASAGQYGLRQAHGSRDVRPCAQDIGASTSIHCNTLTLNDVLERRMTQLQDQLRRIQELLETNVYDVDTYMARSAEVSSRIAAARAELDSQRHDALTRLKSEQLVISTSLLSEYERNASPEVRQRLLSSLLEHVIYRRAAHTRRNGDPTQGIVLELHLKDL